MKTGPALGPAEQAEAVRLVRGGMSQRAVARRFGVSQPTIAKYLSAAPEPDAPPPLPAATTEIDPNGSALDIARGLLSGATAGLTAARATGDGALLQRHARDAGNLALLIARLERDQAKDADVFTCSKSEIAAGIKEIDQKVAALEAGPLFCSGCGKQMRRLRAEEG